LFDIELLVIFSIYFYDIYFQALIREIEDYRITLDMVNKKGRHLAEDNCRVPKMAQQIQSQLRNLEESYLNLQSTAEQIKVSLFSSHLLHIILNR
jgi:hypothetical protein